MSTPPIDATPDLTPQQVTKLQGAVAQLEAIGSVIQNMGQCGIDCRATEAYRVALKQNIERVLQYFGPNRRRT